MKKSMVIVFILLFLFSHNAIANTYPQVFVIREINEETGSLVLEDFNHNTWEWFGNIEDLCIDDIVAATMSDNSTKTIFDDVIVEIRYAGYLGGWE
jgi:hypothetical protein